jgi:hypothetical protein
LNVRVAYLSFVKKVSALAVIGLLATLGIAKGPKVVPCQALVNVNSQADAMDGSVREIMTEMDVIPVLDGKLLRIGYANWAAGNETTNPYLPGFKWFGLEKYPGWQESRGSLGRVRVEAAIRNASG